MSNSDSDPFELVCDQALRPWPCDVARQHLPTGVDFYVSASSDVGYVCISNERLQGCLEVMGSKKISTDVVVDDLFFFHTAMRLTLDIQGLCLAERNPMFDASKARTPFIRFLELARLFREPSDQAYRASNEPTCNVATWFGGVILYTGSTDPSAMDKLVSLVSAARPDIAARQRAIDIGARIEDASTDNVTSATTPRRRMSV